MNTKGSQDSMSYPLFNTPKDGRGKYRAKNGAPINRGTQEMTKDKHNSFQKSNQGDAEETKELHMEGHFLWHSRTVLPSGMVMNSVGQVICAWKGATILWHSRETSFCQGVWQQAPCKPGHLRMELLLILWHVMGFQ